MQNNHSFFRVNSNNNSFVRKNSQKVRAVNIYVHIYITNIGNLWTEPQNHWFSHSSVYSFFSKLSVLPKKITWRNYSKSFEEEFLITTWWRRRRRERCCRRSTVYTGKHWQCVFTSYFSSLILRLLYNRLSLYRSMRINYRLKTRVIINFSTNYFSLV